MIFFITYGQEGNYIGLDIGGHQDEQMMYIRDFAPLKLKSSSPSIGLTLGHRFASGYSLESGLYLRNIPLNLNSRLRPNANYEFVPQPENSLSYIQVPLRFKYDLNLYKQKLFLVPTIGLSLNYNLKGGENLRQQGISVTDGAQISYLSNVYKTTRKIFPLLETGLGLNVPIGPDFSFNVKGIYHMGFSQASLKNRITEYENGVRNTTYHRNQGNNFGLSFGIQYFLKNKRKDFLNRQDRSIRRN